jgi:hypothetical protein
MRPGRGARLCCYVGVDEDCGEGWGAHLDCGRMVRTQSAVSRHGLEGLFRRCAFDLHSFEKIKILGIDAASHALPGEAARMRERGREAQTHGRQGAARAPKPSRISTDGSVSRNRTEKPALMLTLLAHDTPFIGAGGQAASCQRPRVVRDIAGGASGNTGSTDPAPGHRRNLPFAKHAPSCLRAMRIVCFWSSEPCRRKPI